MALPPNVGFLKVLRLYPDSPQCTVQCLISSWLRWAEDYYPHDSGSTPQWLRPVFKTALAEWADTNVNEFRPRHLRELRDRLVERNNSRSYVNEQVSRFVGVFRWGVEWEYVEPLTLQALQAVRPLKRGRTTAYECPPILPVSSEHVAAAIQHLHWPVADMVWAQVLLGCRPGEVCKLRGEQIKPFEDIHLIELTEHKTAWRGKRKIIVVGPRAWAVLKRYTRLRHPSQYLFSPRLASVAAGYSVANRGDCYGQASYRRAVHRACDRAGIPRWNVGQLRHSAAVNVNRELGINHASAILGHASITTTEIYTYEEIDPKAIEAARKIG